MSWCINYLCSDFCYFRGPVSTEDADPELAIIFADAKLSETSTFDAEAPLPENLTAEDPESEPIRSTTR